jgi:hypothetical protein
MEKFMTQFEISGVKTNVTLQAIEENKFGFVTHLSDDFDGGELTPDENERDGVVFRNDQGRWELEGECRITLSAQDIQNLGAAIEEDYL